MTIAPIPRRVEALACLLAAALLALLMLPTVAVAQVPVATSTVPQSVPASPPICWPAQVPTGAGTAAVVVSNEWGRCFRWWCPRPGADAEAAGFCSPWWYTLKLPDKMPASLADSARVLWDLNVTDAPPTEPIEIMLRQDSWIALQASRPAVPRWLVALNGVSLTRPAYSYTERTVADGTKQIVLDPAPVRATVGKVCDCAALKYAPGSVTYCLIPPASLSAATTVPKPVAVCRLQ